MFVYLAVTVLVAVFGIVYEHYSFGVYSNWMIYAFAFPLILGFVPALLYATVWHQSIVPMLSRKMWHAGIAVWTVGSLFTGVITIYGTDSVWSFVYAVAGAALLAAAIFFNITGSDGARKSK